MYPFFIHSSADEHVGCFHASAIVRSVTMTTGVQVSFWTIVFFRYMPRTGTAGSHGNSIFGFLRNLYTILHTGCINLHSHRQWRRVPFNPHAHQHIPFVDFKVMAILTRVWSSIIVTLTSLIISDVEHFFTCWLPICTSSLGKCLFRSSAHFLTGLFGLWYWVGWGIYTFSLLTPCWSSFTDTFSHMVERLLVLSTVSFAKASKFNSVPLDYICYHFYCLRRQVQKNTAMTYVKECSACFLFNELHGLQDLGL